MRLGLSCLRVLSAPAVLVAPSFCGCSVLYVNASLYTENTLSPESLHLAHLLLILLWNKVLTQGKNNCLGHGEMCANTPR